ncbi:cytochrome P450 monooxygenase pc-3 [Guyanagaster necrorhizus]|uniref:Cytochrome P450 monooxygenase pc-3 n=1 Tax=Guyanagaster necrorhizus TaxID=856835 RepID=A0A9P8AM12_9AGAR|nr:cytochrome P450 monooxygenase pc-3 [Guyanagaster necrorhizus MCA 3950]KAG7440390.1 cytochrome P450 monooxygenase pc-3 [Guyanagaster necrorhizus MCA 3950]
MNRDCSPLYVRRVVAGQFSFSPIMTTSYLPPGLVFLFRTLFFVTIVPSSTFWVFQILAGLSLPLWFCLVVPLASQIVFAVAHNCFMSFRIKRHAAAQGAFMVPSVQGSSISILRQVLHSFRNGYPLEIFQKWSEEYGNTFTFNSFSERRMFTVEPEHVKAILATQFQDFEKGHIFYVAADSLLGSGVFNSDDDTWKFHRTMTRPLFNKDRISDFENFEKHAVSMISQIKSRLREGYPVDFQDAVARFTLDSATEYLFGKDVNSSSAGLPYPAGSPLANNPHFVNHPSNVFLKAFAAAQEQSAIRLQRGKYWPLLEFWADAVKPLRQVVNEFVEPLLVEALNIKARGDNPVEDKKDFDEGVSLLTRLVENTDDTKLIRDELVNILVAGRDTTASLLTFAVYMMSEHPEVATRLRSEILEKVGTKTPTFEDIRDMKYLRAFLNEILRLYPPVPMNSRMSKVTTTLPNKGGAPYYIPDGTRIIYSVFLMHRRTDLWGPDALEFDPDRFLDQRLHKYLTRNPFIFVPFNAGPRICLGQQFAYNEASYYLIRLLQTFSSFRLAPDAQPAEGIPPKNWTKTPGTTKGRDKIMFGLHLTMYAKAGLWVRMEEARDDA